LVEKKPVPGLMSFSGRWAILALLFVFINIYLILKT